MSRRASLTLLLLCEVAGMAPWFSASAVAPFLQAQHALSGFQQALLTSSVQLGFAAGTLISAALGLADRLEPRRFFALAATSAAAFTTALSFSLPGSAWAAPLRFGTGFCLAGVYPVGMRIAASWAKDDLGFLVGALTGAVTLGAATPHLLSAFGGLHWQATLLGAAGCAASSAALIGLVGLGPRMAMSQRFDMRGALEPLHNRQLLLADLSYLGHAWELAGMWTWIGAFLAASFAAHASAPNNGSAAELIAFFVIGLGAPGCPLSGYLADRIGRDRVTIGTMAVSGCCALLVGMAFGGPPSILVAICIVWGIAVVPDGAQCSASAAELCRVHWVGTALTVQTSVGFLITLVPIHLMPLLVRVLGWRWAFAPLALGPLLGILAVLSMRRPRVAISEARS